MVLIILINIFNRGAAWEDKFLDTVGEYEETGYFKHIAVARFASRTLDHELEKNTRTVIPYFSSTFVLMAVFRYVLFFTHYFFSFPILVFFFATKLF